MDIPYLQTQVIKEMTEMGHRDSTNESNLKTPKLVGSGTGFRKSIVKWLRINCSVFPVIFSILEQHQQSRYERELIYRILFQRFLMMT